MYNKVLDPLVRSLIRRGLRQGLIEGNAIWVAIGALAWLVRLLLRSEAPKVVRQELKLGESILVTHAPPPAARRRGGGR